MSKDIAAEVQKSIRGAEISTWRLNIVVLLCGASLMALEMVGVRILEPFFGSTIYVWGSIIGIFLGALSFGYWLGGMLADKYPKMSVLGILVFFAAALIFAIPLVAAPLCEGLVKTDMGPRMRALLGSLTLYTAPSALLGMVSPFAVRLAAHQVTNLGRIAGRLYALGTVGSLIGTFSVTFVLVEIIGSYNIIFGIGTLLVVVALLCFTDRNFGLGKVTPGLAMILIGLGWLGLQRAEVMAVESAIRNPEAAATITAVDLPSPVVLRPVLQKWSKEPKELSGGWIWQNIAPATRDGMFAELENNTFGDENKRALVAVINHALWRDSLFDLQKEKDGLPPILAKRLGGFKMTALPQLIRMRINRILLSRKYSGFISEVPPSGVAASAGDSPYGVQAADWFLESRESAYHNIAIIEQDSYLAPDTRSRFMMFNNQIESGIHLGDDGELPKGKVESGCGYTRLLHLGVLLTERAPRKVLVIGCGGGIAPQEFVQDYGKSVELVDVVDIDHVIFEMAHKYFGLPENDPVIKCHVADGRLFVARSKTNWDYVILDAYTAGGRIPRHLITREFFENVKSHSTDDGVVVANIISAMTGSKSRLYRAVYTTMASVFGKDNIYVFPRSRNDESGAMNIMFVATMNNVKLSKHDIETRLVKHSGSLIKQPGLTGPVEGMKMPYILEGDIKDGIFLTDDFCPTDSMVLD